MKNKITISNIFVFFLCVTIVMPVFAIQDLEQPWHRVEITKKPEQSWLYKKYKQGKKFYKKNKEIVIGAICMVTGVALGHVAWPTIKKMLTNSLNDDIMIGSSECKGKEWRINDKFVVKQIRVKNQFDADGGGALSCGFHSLKNGILIVRELQNLSGDLQKRVLDTQVVQEFFGPSGTWRKLVRESSAIDSYKLRSLIGKLDLPCPVTVLGSLGEMEVNDDGLGGDPFDLLKDEVERFKGNNVALGMFIVGNMRDNSQRVEEIYKEAADMKQKGASKEAIRAKEKEAAKLHTGLGHWVTAVVHKKGNDDITLYVADSCNVEGKHTSSSIRKLISRLFGNDLAY